MQNVHTHQIVSHRLDIAVAWEALFAFDAMIFILTILKTYKERVGNKLVGRLNLISLMFRDGESLLTVRYCQPLLIHLLDVQVQFTSGKFLQYFALNKDLKNNQRDDACTGCQRHHFLRETFLVLVMDCTHGSPTQVAAVRMHAWSPKECDFIFMTNTASAARRAVDGCKHVRDSPIFYCN